MFDEYNFGEGFNFGDNDDEIKAYSLYENGQMVKALDILETALQRNPESSTLHFNRALTLDALERYEEAIESYKIALQSSPFDVEILNSMAIDYTRTGFYDLAIETFEQIHAIDPNFEPAYCNSIITYTEMGKLEQAEEAFYMAQQLNPDCPLCFYNIGNSLFYRQEYKKAIWCWKKTAQLDQKHPQIYYRIAQAYWAMNELESAKNYFVAELRKNPGNYDVVFDFAIFYLQNNNLAAAKEKLNTLTELNPDFGKAWHYLGEIALKENNDKQASIFFEKAINADDCFAGPRYRLAQYHFRNHNGIKAIELLKEEMDFEITDADTLVSMGTIFLSLNFHDYASHCFLKATDEDPKNPLPFYYLGLSMKQAGELRDCIHFFNYAIGLDNMAIKNYFQLIDVYDKLQQFDKAIRIANNALFYFPNEKIFKLSIFVLHFKKIKYTVKNFLMNLRPFNQLLGVFHQYLGR